MVKDIGRKMPGIGIWSAEDVRMLFHNKFVVIIGDSIQRGIYKDIVHLMQEDDLLYESDLKSKGEESFKNDTLIEGGTLGKMTNGKDYKEVRQYQTDHNLVRFYYVTRCYSLYLETVLADLEEEPLPDVVIMNSALWDITRYGPTYQALENYKLNLQRLCVRLEESLPKHCLFIWNTAMPVGQNIKGGFLIKDVAFLEGYMTPLIKEGNHYAHQVMLHYKKDILDLHYYFNDKIVQLQRRVKDGIHWDAIANRRIVHLLLAHVCRAWGVPLPARGSRGGGDSKAQTAGGRIDGSEITKQTWFIEGVEAPPRRHHYRSSTATGAFAGGNRMANNIQAPAPARAANMFGPQINCPNGVVFNSVTNVNHQNADFQWTPYEQNNINGHVHPLGGRGSVRNFATRPYCTNPQNSAPHHRNSACYDRYNGAYYDRMGNPQPRMANGGNHYYNPTNINMQPPAAQCGNNGYNNPNGGNPCTFM